MRASRLPWIIGAVAVLLVNSAYLWAFAEPSVFYFSNVALHVGLGIATSAAALHFLIARRPVLPRSMSIALALTGAGVLAGLAVTRPAV
jgi:hypothetical protein